MRLVDTDILIDHFHGVPAATEYIANAIIADGEVFISVVSVTEILAGMRTGEERATEELLALFTIQPVDEAIARVAGKYLNQLGSSHGLELGDSVIAATAKLLGAELITRNLKHYTMSDIVVRAPYERGRKKK